MRPVVLADVSLDRKVAAARALRADLYARCRSILAELGDEVSGFALVVWDREGELRSAYDTGYGPLRPAIIPTLASDALNRHVALDMATPDRITPNGS
jgi:hypothetical protein